MDELMIVEALVEIPKGSRNKYEYDEALGKLRLDRVLFSPLHYPADYGFILDTLAEDGDHLDILIVTLEPSFPASIVPARPIGVLDMRDDKGRDQKILAVPQVDPRFREILDLPNLTSHWLAEIEHFFQVYKTLEEKETEIYGWSGVQAARGTILEAQNRYQKARAQS